MGNGYWLLLGKPLKMLSVLGGGGGGAWEPAVDNPGGVALVLSVVAKKFGCWLKKN